MSAQEDRRSALARLVIGGFGALSVALAGLVGLVASPRAARTARRWRPVTTLFDLPPDAPLAAVIAERQADGWYQTRRQSIVFIDREGDGYRALSATCSHLGCRVKWDGATSQYLCPCHGGVYDREGRVVSGPPPAPLRRLPVRVNDQTSEIEVEL
jgi:nitrite reductase/ring-hydroxylating ferredoxin subunit